MTETLQLCVPTFTGVPSDATSPMSCADDTLSLAWPVMTIDFRTRDDVDVETIDIDFGRAFDGPKGFRGLSDAAQREWIESTLAKVAHLPADSNVRMAVNELVEEIAS